MTESGFTLFDTAIGWCAIAWSARGIAGVQLPEENEAAGRARMKRRFPHAQETPPPTDVRNTIENIIELLRGEPRDFTDAALDMKAVPPFHRHVYEIARTIPPGTTTTYGDIATRLGRHDAARAVGEALSQNPFPIIVPCHRVVAAGGKTGGFSAHGGVGTKLRLLTIEGALPEEPPSLFDSTS